MNASTSLVKSRSGRRRSTWIAIMKAPWSSWPGFRRTVPAPVREPASASTIRPMPKPFTPPIGFSTPVEVTHSAGIWSPRSVDSDRRPAATTLVAMSSTRCGPLRARHACCDRVGGQPRLRGSGRRHGLATTGVVGEDQGRDSGSGGSLAVVGEAAGVFGAVDGDPGDAVRSGAVDGQVGGHAHRDVTEPVAAVHADERTAVEVDAGRGGRIRPSRSASGRHTRGAGAGHDIRVRRARRRR